VNGTTETGLAGEVTTTLKNEGYPVKSPDNAATTNKTTLYFAADADCAVQGLAAKFFEGMQIKPVTDAPTSIQILPDADITVVLGADFLAGGNASPSAANT
jgi:hypothetical protein